MTLIVQITETLRAQVVLDIPEFTSFLLAHVKLACVDKDVDPRYSSYRDERERHRKLMVDTLTGQIPDDDDTVEQDLDHYHAHT